jgi:hypothetical protein
MSDAERAAALWLAQMDAFARAIERLPNARTVNAEAFFAASAKTLRLAADHLGVPMTDEEVESAVEGPLFATYSKNPQLQFNNEMRLERRSDLEVTLASEVEEAGRWVEQKARAQHAIETIGAATLAGIEAS